ncbi:hypothetical protein LR48_Vigan05g073400 [Vigna angularis]|uniref:Homologous recombination OB-fold protein OB-fold domain-containing protein n=1 Tax=Phaseolus angularis TaxID=3914 RepID=A0A0L9UJS5_PHAAN|nr:hypothetical protein LR48_Vigan05g073400 [Vigna angularis]
MWTGNFCIIMDAWEDLVYDDDVLESFLKKCDASATLIPGPAGLVKDGKFDNVNSLQEAKSAEVLPLVVCILKECKPNGLGDMQLSLKDPTATMKASLHNKVLEDPEIADNIGVGHPFTTFRQNHYLNITHRFIVKVFPAEVSPLTIDLAKETPKPVIQLPMWAEKELNVDDILRKFVRPSDQPSMSNQGDNQ